MANLDKIEQRRRRKARIRGAVSGTAERPRLSVFRSCKHIYAQVIDDESATTLASSSTTAPTLKVAVAEAGAKTDRAKLVGEAIAKLCLARGINQVVFDRNGYLYHGRVKAVAEAAREAGLNF